MKKRVMLILSCLLLSVGFIVAQTTRINGTVVDSNGEPVISASVVVKGTQVGTVTDLDGEFSINVPEGRNTLVFTLVGMKTTEARTLQGMKVVMDTDETLLDEVMVVAYGTAKRSQFTGSASVVKADDIKDIQVASVSKALAGKMAGVQVTSTSGRPGADATIRIRGVGSINASNNPLYVLDGVPYEGQLNTINQQDIESMTVLKDAAANSLYGARGANGVILITTKRGSNDGKTKVNVDAKWGVNSRAIPLYDMVSNPADYYELYWQSMRNQQYYSLGSSWSESGMIASRDLVSTLGGYNMYNIADGLLVNPATGKINPNAKALYRDSWEDEIFKNGLRQEYQVGVSGGNNKTSYYLSLGYLEDEGIVDNSDFKRITSRLRLEHNVTNWLKVGANAAYTNSKTKFTNEDGTEGSNMFYIVQTMAPIYPVYEYDADGNRLYEKNGTPIYDFGAGDVNPNHLRPISSMANPIASQILDKETDRVNTFSGQVFAEIRFLNDFKFSTNIRFDNSDNLGIYYQNGQYGQFASFGGISTRYTERSTAINANQMLQWNKAFNNDHNLDIMVSHESYQRKYNYTYGSKRTFFDPNNIELNGAISTPQSGSYENNYRVESVLGRIQYDYLSKYFFSASFRTDGSSKFHKDNRWGQFWSVGASWLLTKEDFLKPVNWLDELKFKISYGQQGNDNLNVGGILPWANQYTVKANGDAIALERSYIGNKNITWEKSNSFNTGVEFSVLKNRLYGGIEYFNRMTKDLLFSRKMPLSAGYSSYPDNIGDMLNQGVELELTGEIIRTKDWNWNLSLNATHYTNKIKKLPPESVEGGIDAGLFWYREGKSMYDYYLWDYAGVNSEGESQWYKDVVDADGKVKRELTTDYTEATRYYQGSALPDVYGGISTSVSWKGLNLSIQTAYQFGGTGYDYTYRNLMHSGEAGQAWHKDIYNSWTPENTKTNIPRLEKGNAAVTQAYSNRWLVSTDYFSIQNIMLGYTFPKHMLNKFSISSLRVYGVADNVAIFSKRKGYDPRESVSGVNSYGRYTPIRTISFGLNVEF